MGPELFECVSQVTKTGLVGISASAFNLLPTALDIKTPVTDSSSRVVTIRLR